MISRSLLIALAAIFVALTFAHASPFEDMLAMRRSGTNDGAWMMDGEKENKDESTRMIQLFMKCLKFLQEKHAEEEKERKLHEFFKYFVKSMEELKVFHRMLDGQRPEGNLNKALQRFFDREDLDDNDDNAGDDMMKKLFFVFMRFRAFIKEMREKESEGKEEKYKKQFFVFVKFMKFAKECKARLEMLGQLSKIIESRFKVKFITFKRCMQEGECLMSDDDEDMGGYDGQGQDEDEKKFGEHFEMFFNMMKHLREDQGGILDILGEHGGYPNDEKTKIPVLELLMKLHKHVSERGKEFWGDKDLSPEEKMKKFVFFAYNVYQHAQELVAMKERKAKIMELFYKFCKFLEQHENAARAQMEYARFQKWQDDRRNQAKVAVMENFLRKAAIFKRMMAEKKDQEGKEESMKRFFELRMKEHIEREKDDKEEMMKRLIDERMEMHMRVEKNDKEEMMKKFFDKMKEKNQEQEREQKLKMKAMLQMLEHTDL